MPSGGGGFHGGGGYRGGGFYGGRGGKCKPLTPKQKVIGVTITAILIPVVTCAALMGTLISHAVAKPNTAYSPGDTRLIELNTLFCSRITLEDKSKSVDAQLYLLTKDEIPPITDRNNFTIEPEFSVKSNNYQYWQYHLYPNSNVTISACILSGTSVTLNVIKGSDKFNDWTRGGPSSTERVISISQLCSDLKVIDDDDKDDGDDKYDDKDDDSANLVLTIGADDEWYFAFANRGDGTSKISAKLSFERFQYTTSTLVNATHTCSSDTTDDCSFDVRFMSSRRYALIVTSIPEDVDWSENVDVDYECGRNHGGYFLVTGVPLFFLLLLVCFIAGMGAVGLYIVKNKFTSSSQTKSQPDTVVMTSKTLTTDQGFSNEVLTAEYNTQQTQPIPSYMNPGLPPPTYSSNY